MNDHHAPHWPDEHYCLHIPAMRALPLQSLPLTGERTMPGVTAENYWFRRHEMAYEFLRERVSGATLLEVGCGEGYGSALLTGTAVQVLGIDYDEFAIGHCARTYPQASFARANLAALPVRSDAIDALVSLQVIEHVWDHRQFIAECMRVLRPGGEIIISTPNRLTFSPDNDGNTPPTNPFHTHEFTSTELANLLSGCGLRDLVVYGLHAGPGLHRLDREHAGSFVAAQLSSPPSEWDSRLVADVASISTADFVIAADCAESPADVSLDLLITARV